MRQLFCCENRGTLNFSSFWISHFSVLNFCVSQFSLQLQLHILGENANPFRRWLWYSAYMIYAQHTYIHTPLVCKRFLSSVLWTHTPGGIKHRWNTLKVSVGFEEWIQSKQKCPLCHHKVTTITITIAIYLFQLSTMAILQARTFHTHQILPTHTIKVWGLDPILHNNLTIYLYRMNQFINPKMINNLKYRVFHHIHY